jgi:hypothetical protein
MTRLAAACAVTTLSLAAALALPAVLPTLSAQRRAVPRDAAVPFKVGERLTYDVTWSSYLVAGTAVTTVVDKQPSANSTAYSIVAEGQPVPLLGRLYTLFYKMDTVLDSTTLLPHRGSLFIQEGQVRRRAVTRFDRATRKAFFEVEDEATLRTELDIPQQAQDGLSALYVLRAMTFKPGERITVPVVDDGALYTLRANAMAIERVRVPIGALDAWNLAISIVDAKGQPAASDAAVWISSDSRRLPLKLQAKLPVGDFVLVLREAR